MPRPVHFEIPAANVDRARKFYSSVFEWSFTTWDGPFEYHLINTGDKGPGINGGLMKANHPEQPVTCTLDLPDIDAYMKKVSGAGGQIVLEKQTIPGVGYSCFFKDTEVNLFGMMKMDEKAG